MEFAALLWAFGCCVSVTGVRGSNGEWWENYMQGIQEHMSLYGYQEFPEKAGSHAKLHPPFVCPDMSPSPTVPTSVDKVKAADVKIVAALGDSLTTAIGANATNILELPYEYRHLSWSIGGYGKFTEVITLPNIFRLFNPDLVGYSRNRTLNNKPAPLEQTGLNLAVTGANTYEFPEQTRHLIQTLKSYPGVDFNNDWKVITIFIGANDLCDYCKNKTLFSAESFIANLTSSLDMLHMEVPRAIVNVVQLFKLEGLRQVNDGSFGCLLQKSFCSCLVKPKDNSPELLELIDQNKQFQNRLEELVSSDRYKNTEDFAVILQPFLKRVQPPKDSNGKIDYSFFTPDCFHFTIKGHEELAKGLWNNMFQPEGQKAEVDTFSTPVQLICPSEAYPYIHTGRRTRSLASSSPKGAHVFHILIILMTIFVL
ncbi:phospholipase B1, membrane-associated-like [Pleurodeles waltl]|uniref:phospholipase B1, membrane-associated-like n=1 Tax=Pleurodeles waltl TaxID=8319 RepID=UPI003709B244